MVEPRNARTSSSSTSTSISSSPSSASQGYQKLLSNCTRLLVSLFSSTSGIDSDKARWIWDQPCNVAALHQGCHDASCSHSHGHYRCCTLRHLQLARYLRCSSDMTWLPAMRHLDATCRHAGAAHLLSLCCIKAYVQKILHDISLI